MKNTIIVKNELGLDLVTKQVKELLDSGKHCTIDIEEGERTRRSLTANALLAVWIAEIAEWEGSQIKDVRNAIKRDFGLDIILGEGDEISKQISFTLEKIGYDSMRPEQQANVMNMLAITSIMTTAQHNRLRDAIQHYYAEQDLKLEIK